MSDTYPKLDNHAIVHPENREKLAREDEEHGAEDRGAGETDAGRNLDPGDSALGLARSQILPGDRRRSTHQPHRCPRDEREELTVTNGERCLRGRALGK